MRYLRHGVGAGSISQMEVMKMRLRMIIVPVVFTFLFATVTPILVAADIEQSKTYTPDQFTTWNIGEQPQRVLFTDKMTSMSFEDFRTMFLSFFYGIFRCHFAGACSEACPKGIDPAFAIQLLKKEIMKRSVLKAAAPEPATVMSWEQENPPKQDKVPAAPPRSVE